MAHYAGLDVSLKETAVCVVDEAGKRVFEGKLPTDPACLARVLRSRAPEAVRIGLESGPTSAWLCATLRQEGLPVVCLDARQAHAALSLRPNKSDQNDARGLAEIVRMGWFREVQVKSLSTHERRALLAARHRLVETRVGLDNQLRGILKTFGLVIGPSNSTNLARRAEALTQGHPGLAAIVSPLLAVRTSLLEQIAVFDRAVGQLIRSDDTVRRLMTVPGVGPITALAFITAIEDPARFTHARDVGAYFGLTPTRYQSGETDRAGRISKCGDPFTRKCLYEAAGVLITKVQRWSSLKAWGVRLMQRAGGKKAKVAVARKLAVILHRIWTDGTEFWWTKETATA
jgi:transposase